MTPEAILAIVSGLIQVTPQLMALFQSAKNGTPVSASQVQAALAGYGVAHAQLDADIKAAGG